MNIRQLQYVRAVSDAGSFSAAARELGVTVQAISKSIVELEEELGHPLFERGNTGARPTAFCRSFAPEMNGALDAFERAETFAKRWRDGDRGRTEIRLAIAVPPFTGHRVVCAGVGRLLSMHMKVPVRVSVSDGAAALDLMRAGLLDALITIGLYENRAFNCFPVGTLPVGVFLSRDHPLAVEQSLRLADLAPYPVCFAATVDSFNETIVNLYLRNGLASPLAEVACDADAERVIMREQGYSLMVGAAGFAPSRQICMRPIDPADAVPVPVCVVTPVGHQSGQVALIDRFMRENFGKIARLFS